MLVLVKKHSPAAQRWEGTAAAALPALRTVMAAAAAAYTAVYRFCTLFAMEPWLQGMNPFPYYTVSRLVHF